MNTASPCPLTGHPAGGLRKILRAIITASLALVASCLAACPAHAVTIDWVTVGDPGNTADNTGHGAVSYDYQISKYEVTIQQYADFLNAVAATDTYSLYNSSMASDSTSAGISQNGSSGSYSYGVIGTGNRPITFVSWFDAARFANWMQNGQGSSSTETGAYTLNGATSGDAVARNSGATFYIPTESEWYKAAYYSPVKGGVGSPGYYTYATQSDSTPGNTIGSGANQVNYKNAVYSVTGSSSLTGNQNYLTNVGAFTNNASHYGTFDQNGNVFEWNDLAGASGSLRGLRGGGWNNGAAALSKNLGNYYPHSIEMNEIGFRLASPIPLPEPSTWVMGAAGLACAAWRRRRWRS